jgi:alcohol dehydrogenase, propanol-preferring
LLHQDARVAHTVIFRLWGSSSGNNVVCAGIQMSDTPSFPYSLLWRKRVLRSVANLTRADGEAFLTLAPRAPVRRR